MDGGAVTEIGWLLGGPPGGRACSQSRGAVISQAELMPDLGMESMVSEFGGFRTLVPQPPPCR